MKLNLQIGLISLDKFHAGYIFHHFFLTQATCPIFGLVELLTRPNDPCSCCWDEGRPLVSERLTQMKYGHFQANRGG
jgi:hypothetical protein